MGSFGFTTSETGITAQKCSELIDEAFFRGASPDLAGTGVFTTYLLQGIFIVTLGAIASIVSACIPTDPRRTAKQAALRLQSLFLPTFKAAWLLAMVTFISIFVRMTQAPPLFEVAIMRDVNEYQASIMLLGALAYVIQRCIGHSVSGDDSATLLRDAQVWLYTVIQFVFKWIVATKISKTLSNSTAAHTVISECTKLDRFAKSLPLRKVVPSMWAPTEGGWQPFLAALFFCLFVLLPLAITLVGFQKWPWTTTFMKARPTRVASAVLLTALLTCSVTVEILAIIETRSTILRRSEFINASTQWGFFQTAAVALWLPIAIRGLLVVLGLFPFGIIWLCLVDLLMALGYGKESLPRDAEETKEVREHEDAEAQPNGDDGAGEATTLLEEKIPSLPK